MLDRLKDRPRSILADEVVGPLNAQQHEYLQRLWGGADIVPLEEDERPIGEGSPLR